MNNKLQLSVFALFAAVPAAYAQTTTYAWTDTGSPFGNAAGTITIDSTTVGSDASIGGVFSGNGYDYTIVGMTGTFTSGAFGGSSITGIDTSGVIQLNLSTSTPSSASLLGLQSAIYVAGQTVVLDGGTDISLGSAYEMYYYAYSPTGGPRGMGGSELYNDGGHDTFTLGGEVSPVPESPLSPGLVAGAGLLVGWQSWRKVRAARA